jgi:uncharacterized protein (DUF488 family)
MELTVRSRIFLREAAKREHAGVRQGSTRVAPHKVKVSKALRPGGRSHMAYPFFTIGHSTRPVDEFVDLLKTAQVDLVADVRTVPRSRTNPQYNFDTLPQALAPFAIAYEHIAALGGLRARTRDVSANLNAFWENRSFHNYADYALSEPFRQGLEQLRALGEGRRCAIMCAEAVWWRCHRRIIADYLIAEGERVFHILSADRIEPARMTPAARRRPDGTLVYAVQDQS